MCHIMIILTKKTQQLNKNLKVAKDLNMMRLTMKKMANSENGKKTKIVIGFQKSPEKRKLLILIQTQISDNFT